MAIAIYLLQLGLNFTWSFLFFYFKRIGFSLILRWIFAALSAGGKVDMPMSDAFRGSYFGLFTDKFGIQWMGSYEKPPVKLIKEVCS
jgi:hypothetical protein